MPQLRRAALLIGFTYNVASQGFRGITELTAPQYDLPRVAALLNSKGITDITIVTDTSDWRQALAENIRAALKTFIKKTIDDRLDFAFIYYAGHGAQITGVLGNEMPEIVDGGKDQYAVGQDEAIVPLDANMFDPQNPQAGGPILDDEISTILRAAYKPCNITLVMDCCNSGTIADLKFEYDSPKRYVVNQRARNHDFQTIIAFGGSRDLQLSYESTPDGIGVATGNSLLVPNPSLPGGYLTAALLDALTRNWSLNQSVLSLFEKVQETLASLDSLIEGGLPQKAQMNSSRKVTISDPFILE